MEDINGGGGKIDTEKRGQAVERGGKMKERMGGKERKGWKEEGW